MELTTTYLNFTQDSQMTAIEVVLHCSISRLSSMHSDSVGSTPKQWQEIAQFKLSTHFSQLTTLADETNSTELTVTYSSIGSETNSTELTVTYSSIGSEKYFLLFFLFFIAESKF